MKKRLETISIVFGALFIIGIILALVLSPLRGSYFNYSNYMDRALVVSGIDKGKIETARAQTNLISETTGLDISKTSNVRKKIASSSAESNKSNNYTSTKQPYDYDVASKSQISMFSEPTKNSVNTNQIVSPIVPNASFIASTNIDSKKKASTTNNLLTTGYVSTTTNLTAIQNPKAGARMDAHGNPPPSEGGGDGIPNLPVGNGLNFMLILAVAFGGWKIRKSIL